MAYNTTTKELEKDAENAEKKAAYEVDPIMTIEVNGHNIAFSEIVNYGIKERRCAK